MFFTRDSFLLISVGSLVNIGDEIKNTVRERVDDLEKLYGVYDARRDEYRLAGDQYVFRYRWAEGGWTIDKYPEVVKSLGNQFPGRAGYPIDSLPGTIDGLGQPLSVFGFQGLPGFELIGLEETVVGFGVGAEDTTIPPPPRLAGTIEQTEPPFDGEEEDVFIETLRTMLLQKTQVVSSVGGLTGTIDDLVIDRRGDDKLYIVPRTSLRTLRETDSSTLDVLSSGSPVNSPLEILSGALLLDLLEAVEWLEIHLKYESEANQTLTFSWTRNGGLTFVTLSTKVLAPTFGSEMKRVQTAQMHRKGQLKLSAPDLGKLVLLSVTPALVKVNRAG